MNAEPTPFERIGGLDGVRALVDRFYDLMEELPEAAPIRAMHPKDMRMSREKLYLFLCGWMGGPPLYIERFGHPRLRARHLSFPIGDDESNQWMLCMRRALDELDDTDLADFLAGAFERTALHMRNQGSMETGATWRLT